MSFTSQGHFAVQESKVQLEGIDSLNCMSGMHCKQPISTIPSLVLHPLPLLDWKPKCGIVYGAPGVQHIALHTENIVETVQTLVDRGLCFVPASASYYDLLPERVGEISESLSALQVANVLVDRDAWGYLLQIFSKPLQDRPTLFIEIIQRKNARGFGSGNIQALFNLSRLAVAICDMLAISFYTILINPFQYIK
jgi:hypothetical protein